MTTPHATPVHFHAGYNMPGYLPESEPATFATFDEARQYMAAELREHAYNVGSWAEEHDCDDIPCPSYGDDCPDGKASALNLAADLLDQDGGPAWDHQVDGMAYWITPCQDPDCGPFDASDYIADAAALVTCATCGERHWFLADDDGTSTMVSLPGFTCGQEEPDELELPPLRKALPEAPKLERRHFQFIADVIASMAPAGGVLTADYVVEHFAEALETTNARFNRDRFLQAATGR